MRSDPNIRVKNNADGQPDEKNTRLKVAVVFVFIGVYYFFFKVVF
jgi:hypothetical protein